MFVKTQFHTKIKAIQYDFGGEYRPFTNYLSELGINHRLTCPHTSHQNGNVERKHKHVVEMGLTLLAHASIPITFWDHSFTTYVHLINRFTTPNHPNFNSPFHAIYGKDPDYKSLKVFGCSCFPLLRTYNNTNFNIEVKDVRFHEHDFPFSKLFSRTYELNCQEISNHVPNLTHSLHPPIFNTYSDNWVFSSYNPTRIAHIDDPPNKSIHVTLERLSS